MAKQVTDDSIEVPRIIDGAYVDDAEEFEIVGNEYTMNDSVSSIGMDIEDDKINLFDSDSGFSVHGQ